MSESDQPDFVDTRLLFFVRDNPGRHYFIGHPHTFRGRIEAWNEEGYSLSVSKSEITEMTDAAAIWLDGFLAGSEPPPPETDDGETQRAWEILRATYRATGEM